MDTITCEHESCYMDATFKMEPNFWCCSRGHVFHHAAPAPPTGPTAESYDHEDGRPEKFVAFLATEDGRRFWDCIEDAALGAFQSGARRFSARTFLHKYREREKLRINDHFSPWFADELVSRHPALLEIIERRSRKKVGPVA